MKKSLFKFLEISKDYYQKFAQKRRGSVLAWVTSFTPVEILSAMGIDYIYPESYAAVIAASGNAEKYIEKSAAMNWDTSICSYSTVFNGSFFSGEGPKGIPARPDFLIAANNQCNTLPGWWSYLAKTLDIPLFLLDYPGELNFNLETQQYIIKQHERLIEFLETHTPAVDRYQFSEARVLRAIESSRRAVKSWENIIRLRKEYLISSQVTFDYLLPMVICRCDERTADFYHLLLEDLLNSIQKIDKEKRILWLGYPLWFKNRRYLPAVETQDIKITMDHYSTWWNLYYSGDTWREILVRAYNFTPLNRVVKQWAKQVEEMIGNYRIDGIIFNINKSCKRSAALEWALKDQIDLPSVVIETDMVDRRFLNETSSRVRLDAFNEMMCDENKS
jgi:benzoyl-CoA reductase/2-hydroxyglutaryl-CoA dehydratase subunit BcrC/BadD/HgdB